MSIPSLYAVRESSFTVESFTLFGMSRGLSYEATSRSKLSLVYLLPAFISMSSRRLRLLAIMAYHFTSCGHSSRASLVNSLPKVSLILSHSLTLPRRLEYISLHVLAHTSTPRFLEEAFRAGSTVFLLLVGLANQPTLMPLTSMSPSNTVRSQADVVTAMHVTSTRSSQRHRSQMAAR